MKLISGCALVLSLGGCLWLNRTPMSLAQDTPPPDLTLPEEMPELIEETLPTPPDLSPPEPLIPEPPPEPDLELPTIPAPGESDRLPESSSPEPSFLVQLINVKGSTVLTNEIRDITATYENRDITLEDLFALRTELTELYIANGYITLGAFLPAGQDLTDGTVDIQVVEGIVEGLKITGLRHVKEFYVRDRISLGLNTPFNQQELEEALQLLQLTPNFDRVNAELLEGSAPGLSILSLNVIEATHFQLGVAGDNYRSPNIGSEQFTADVGYANFLGVGDRLTASYSLTEGLDTYALSYRIPINPTDGEVTVSFSNGDSDIIQDDFAELGIRSETTNLSAGFQQPIFRTPTTEFSLGIAFDLRESQTFLLADIPFSFSPGPEAGESRVSVIRLTQDWVDRSKSRVLAARSQFSVGIDAFDVTVNDSGIDGRFFSWLGQFQWAKRLPSNNILVTRLNAQLTPDSLLPLEQFSIGGVSTIRGYRDNQVVTDNGIIGSIELRIPIFPDKAQVQITPFIEGGIGWNGRQTNMGTETLASVGVGLQWQIAERLGLRLDYGYPLIEIEDLGNSLQDAGVYFSISTDLTP